MDGAGGRGQRGQPALHIGGCGARDAQGGVRPWRRPPAGCRRRAARPAPRPLGQHRIGAMPRKRCSGPLYAVTRSARACRGSCPGGRSRPGPAASRRAKAIVEGVAGGRRDAPGELGREPRCSRSASMSASVARPPAWSAPPPAFGGTRRPPVARRPRRRPEQVDQHQRALALVEVADDLLAVGRLGADEVEQVVADLERRAEEEAEPAPSARRSAVRPTRSARPTRSGWTVVYQHVLLHDQVEVVLGRRGRRRRRAASRVRVAWPSSVRSAIVVELVQTRARRAPRSSAAVAAQRPGAPGPPARRRR